MTLGKRSRTQVYSAGLADREIAGWYGAAVTTPGRTLVDLGPHDRRDAVMAADAALRESLVTRADIEVALACAVGWPYSRRAAAVLALADVLTTAAWRRASSHLCARLHASSPG